MTETQHPITPPPELVEKWIAEIWHEGTPVRVAADNLHIAHQAANWGADQELKACCKWLKNQIGAVDPKDLRKERRPKVTERVDFIIQDLNNNAIANVLREVVSQLQYQSFHHTEEFYQLDVDDILTLCNELEKL